MTRKDFVLIAQTIKWSRVDSATRQQIAEDFASALRSTNPRFDSARFIKAATDSEGK